MFLENFSTQNWSLESSTIGNDSHIIVNNLDKLASNNNELVFLAQVLINKLKKVQRALKNEICSHSKSFYGAKKCIHCGLIDSSSSYIPKSENIKDFSPSDLKNMDSYIEQSYNKIDTYQSVFNSIIDISKSSNENINIIPKNKGKLTVELKDGEELLYLLQSAMVTAKQKKIKVILSFKNNSSEIATSTFVNAAFVPLLNFYSLDFIKETLQFKDTTPIIIDIIMTLLEVANAKNQKNVS